MTDLDAFLDALIVQSCRAPNPNRPMTPNDLVDFIRQAKRRATPAEPAAIHDNVTPWLGPSDPAPPEHWSPWLDWHGGPCPLPPDVVFHLDGCGTRFHGSGLGVWTNIRRFRYLVDNPAGWLPRGDWIPPAELWRDDCPVRCEWRAADAGGAQSAGSCQPRNWHTITHIRLVARNLEEATHPEPAAVPGLPEFLHFDEETQSWWVDLGNGSRFWLYSYGAVECDRIAEAASILAAWRRAGL